MNVASGLDGSLDPDRRYTSDPERASDTLITGDPVAAHMEETTLEVRGMSCDGCESTVKNALEALEGVTSATADHETSEVRVSHEETTVDRDALRGTVEDVGYEVSG